MTGFSRGSNHIPYRKILEEISEESILYFYSGISHIPSLINSPLRKDSNPSLKVNYSSSGAGRIRLYDFGTGQSYNVLGFLSELLNLSNLEVLQRITNDLPSIRSIHIEEFKGIEEVRKERKKRMTSSKDIKVKVRKWEGHDVEFWKTFGISKKWACFGHIHPISHIFIGDKAIPADKYAYCYVEFKDGIPSYKIYQPFSEKWKWMSTHSSSVWDLWEQAINSDSKTLIITSSRKDALTLWSNLGIASVSLQSENILPKKNVVQVLQEKFEVLYCLFDNDGPGKKASSIISEAFDLKNIMIPECWNSKDPSDLYKNHGLKTFKKVLNKLII